MRALKVDAADRVLNDEKPAEGKKAGGRKQPRQRAMPRRNRRRRLAWIAGSGALTLLVAAGGWGYSQNWHGMALDAADRGIDSAHRGLGLAVAEVTASGRDRAGPGALREALGVRIGDPILRLDLDELKTRLETLGWVREASVSRQLPDRLHISIEERRPFARWQIGGRTALIDEDGVVIRANIGARYLHLPRLVGPQANLRAAELFELLQHSPRLAAQVKSASLVRERRWDIGMDNGITVRLPEEEPGEAWSRLNDVDRRDGLLAKRLNLIDLRVPGRVIVRRKPKPAEDGPERET